MNVMLLIGSLMLGVDVGEPGIGSTDVALPDVRWPEPRLAFDLKDAMAAEAGREWWQKSAAWEPPAPNGAAGEPVPATKGEEAVEHNARGPGYGRAGSQWLTFGLGYAYDFDDDSDMNVSGAWSIFLCDSFEFGVEGAAWYFNQEGDDTGGLSATMLFRWHFWHAEDYRWTVFGDVGIGILGAFDEVPDGGTGFDFLPRIGAGFTRAFDEGDGGNSYGARWMVGLRYHHISNGRIEGNERNPGRDGVMVYAGITIPF